jgi:hypothetical protein
MDAVTARREIFVAVRGISVTTATVFRFTGGGRTCAQPRALLSYLSARPAAIPPPGHQLIDVSFRVRAAAYRAKRVNLVERYSECAWTTTGFEFDRERGVFAPRTSYLQTAVAQAPAADLAQIVAALRGVLSPLCPGQIEWPLLGATAHEFANPHLVVYFFEFTTEALAASVELRSKSDLLLRRPDGSPERGAHLDWIAGFEPVWFRVGRFLVLSDRAEASALKALRSILGRELVPAHP